MADDFVIARNPEAESTLPYLLRIPLGDGVLLKAREMWPRTSKVYCHRFFDVWPDDAEIVERVPVRSCVRRGAAIDLVLDRGRENRSQFVITTIRGGRQAVFWQTSRTAKQARPGQKVSRARAQGLEDLGVVVDTGERYAWRFSDQQVTTRRLSLPAGDYAVLDADERVRAAVIADGLAEVQIAFPSVPIVFSDNRKLAQEWTYRFLGAAAVAAEVDGFGAGAVAEFTAAAPLPPREPTPAELRAWALANGFDVSPKGRVPAKVRKAWERSRT